MYAAIQRISPGAYWNCACCGTKNRFDIDRPERPLGRLKCVRCEAVANSSTQIRDDSLVQLQKLDYMVVTPIDVETPQTKMGWACCSCGRSHVKTLRKLEHCSAADKRDLKGIAVKMHKTFKKLTAKARNKSSTPATRAAWAAHFWDTCNCEHQCCASCYRYKIPANKDADEWVVEHLTVLTAEDVPVTPAPWTAPASHNGYLWDELSSGNSSGVANPNG